MITFLAGHPQWKERAAAELRHLLAAYTLESEAEFVKHSPRSLSKLSGSLACIPLETWESQTPTLDALIRETLRLAEPHTAIRMNTGPEVQLGGKAIPPETFVVYPFSDVHLSAELYPDPWKFDPGRPESKMPFSYLGWGAGGLASALLWCLSVADCRADRALLSREDGLPRPAARQIGAQAHHRIDRTWVRAYGRRWRGESARCAAAAGLE